VLSTIPAWDAQRELGSRRSDGRRDPNHHDIVLRAGASNHAPSTPRTHRTVTPVALATVHCRRHHTLLSTLCIVVQPSPRLTLQLPLPPVRRSMRARQPRERRIERPKSSRQSSPRWCLHPHSHRRPARIAPSHRRGPYFAVPKVV